MPVVTNVVSTVHIYICIHTHTHAHTYTPAHEPAHPSRQSPKHLLQVGASCCKLLLKASIKGEIEIQEVTVGLANAKEIYLSYSSVSLIRTGRHFHTKRRTKSCSKSFLGANMFSLYYKLALARVAKNHG